MGNGQVGGNGSVHWLVDADEVRPGNEGNMQSRRNNPGRNDWRQRGSDFRGNSAGSGTNFKIRIKPPDDAAKKAAFLAAVTAAVTNAGASGARLEFELEIEKPATPHTQIQVAWGADPGWRDDLP